MKRSILLRLIVHSHSHGPCYMLRGGFFTVKLAFCGDRTVLQVVYFTSGSVLNFTIKP